MTTIRNILFPVDFSPSCIAMAAYVKRSAAMFGAGVTLVTPSTFTVMTHCNSMCDHSPRLPESSRTPLLPLTKQRAANQCTHPSRCYSFCLLRLYEALIDQQSS